MRRRLGTRYRLSAVAVLILLLGVGASAAFAYISLSQIARQSADGTLLQQADVIGIGLEPHGQTLGFVDGELPEQTPDGVSVSAVVRGTRGVLLATRSQQLSAATVEAIAAAVRAGGTRWMTLHNRAGVHLRVYAERLPRLRSQGGVLVLSRSLDEVDSGLSNLLVSLIVLVAVTVVGGGVLTFWLAGSVLRPVRMIADVARSLSEHDLHRRVEVPVPRDEMGDLVDTLNSMLARLESTFEGLRRFTADASHELRAPLALLQTELEVALAGASPPDRHLPTLRGALDQVQHLTGIVEQLLMLARADADDLRPVLGPVDVADFLHETAIRWSAYARDHDVLLDVEAPEAGTVMADEALLRRVLDNLIDNAIRHSPAGGRVVIRGERRAEDWAIDVRDRGPGVPPELRARLFTRFGRLEQARTPGQGGTGLGLALSAAIASAHGGSLRLRDDGERGALFELSLPARTPAS